MDDKKENIVVSQLSFRLPEELKLRFNSKVAGIGRHGKDVLADFVREYVGDASTANTGQPSNAGGVGSSPTQGIDQGTGGRVKLISPSTTGESQHPYEERLHALLRRIVSSGNLIALEAIRHNLIAFERLVQFESEQLNAKGNTVPTAEDIVFQKAANPPDLAADSPGKRAPAKRATRKTGSGS